MPLGQSASPQVYVPTRTDAAQEWPSHSPQSPRTRVTRKSFVTSHQPRRSHTHTASPRLNTYTLYLAPASFVPQTSTVRNRPSSIDHGTSSHRPSSEVAATAGSTDSASTWTSRAGAERAMVQRAVLEQAQEIRLDLVFQVRAAARRVENKPWSRHGGRYICM